MSADTAVKRFACTQCGKCCDRSPEVELSEASALSDVFVFRLMFRLYWLPAQLSEFRPTSESGSNISVAYYEKKRLLSAFAARKYPVKSWLGGKRVSYTKYLMISGLALDTSPGICGALRGTKCGIHERRPLSCQSVPLHYSRAESSAEADLAAFVETPGYLCDTGETSPIVLKDGKIVDPQINASRTKALDAAAGDRRWSEAIVRQMGSAGSASRSLPTLKEIEEVAQSSALTTSMRVAWQIAADVGLMNSGECRRLIELQLGLIEKDQNSRTPPLEARETLADMRDEYRQCLRGISSISLNC